jgi:hypothetical protein
MLNRKLSSLFGATLLCRSQNYRKTYIQCIEIDKKCFSPNSISRTDKGTYLL